MKFNGTIQEREYQMETIRRLLKYGRGLFQIPTRGGKSLIIAVYFWNLICKINCSHFLIIVPTKQLVEQFYGDLLSYGFNEKQICKFVPKHKIKEFPQIIISNKQYLLRHTKELPDIDVVVADEVHEVKKGSATYAYIKSLKTHMVSGCSGSIPDELYGEKQKYDRWGIEELFGLLVYKKSITELQDGGYIGRFKLIQIDITDKHLEKYPKRYRFSLANNRLRLGNDMFNDAYNDEIEYILKNYFRLYDKPLRMIPKLTGNTLILFDRKDFGKDMYSRIKQIISDNGSVKIPYYIDGNTPVNIREDIRKSSEMCDDNVIIAQTATFSTGITINNLHNIIFMFNAKEPPRIIQSIGRTLGLHESKKFSKVFDITFNMKYSQKHYEKRKFIYLNEYNISEPDKIVKIDIE